MSDPQRWYCRNCAYELTQLAEDAPCPECGQPERVATRREVPVYTPWWLRLWPLYVGELTLLPIAFRMASGSNDEGMGMVILGMVFLHSCWLLPFLVVTSIGWTRNFVERDKQRIIAQISACAALVAFPTVPFLLELLNSTDGQAGFAIMLMPIFGSLSAMLGAAFGRGVAQTLTR